LAYRCIYKNVCIESGLSVIFAIRRNDPAQSKKANNMNNDQNNILKADFDRRQRESAAGRYIAEKQFQRVQRRQFWTNVFLGFAGTWCLIWSAVILKVLEVI